MVLRFSAIDLRIILGAREKGRIFAYAERLRIPIWPGAAHHSDIQPSSSTASNAFTHQSTRFFARIKMSRKSVLITGCSEGGIGHCLALEWKSRGYRVFATARTMRSMATLESAEIECFEMDVTDADSLKSVNDQVAQKTGGTLNILVNCAGQGIFSFPTFAPSL